MRNVKKIKFIVVMLALIALAVSCASTGEYMPLSGGETVIGTVQSTFFVQSSFFSMQKVKDSVNTQAYVRLMEAAGRKYHDNIDLRDIVWVTGDKSPDNTKTEIFATAKVVRVE